MPDESYTYHSVPTGGSAVAPSYRAHNITDGAKST